uniref:Conserved domain protein n=1 Tax=Ascaris lumbricoides TaxID=6252 RepID=A0A0M3IUR8_ASCLU
MKYRISGTRSHLLDNAKMGDCFELTTFPDRKTDIFEPCLKIERISCIREPL